MADELAGSVSQAVADQGVPGALMHREGQLPLDLGDDADIHP